MKMNLTDIGTSPRKLAAALRGSRERAGRFCVSCGVPANMPKDFMSLAGLPRECPMDSGRFSGLPRMSQSDSAALRGSRKRAGNLRQHLSDPREQQNNTIHILFN